MTLRAIATTAVSVGGASGSIQYNNGGTLDGAAGLAYNISSVTFTITSQSSGDQVLKISGASGQTAPLISVDVLGVQKALLTAAGRFAVGDWTPTGYAFEASSIALRYPTRYYSFTANDGAGTMEFRRTDSSVGLQINPSTTRVTISPTGVGTTDMIVSGSLANTYITPHASGGVGVIYLGARFDFSAAVGASTELWPATGQTAPALVLKVPGGASSLTQLGVAGDLLIKVNDATKVVETAQAAAAQTANIKENKDSGGAVLSGVAPTGGYFMKLTAGAPAGAGVTGELRFDPATFIMYCYDGAVWRTSTFV